MRIDPEQEPFGDVNRVAAYRLLESAQIQWRRDWDALLVGFTVGALCGSLLTILVLRSL